MSLKKRLRENPVLVGLALSYFADLGVEHGLQLDGWEWTLAVLAISAITGISVRRLVVPMTKLRKVDPSPEIALVDGPRPYDAVRAGDRVMVSEVVDALQETYSTSRWLDGDEVPGVIGAISGDSFGSGRIEIINRPTTGEVFVA